MILIIIKFNKMVVKVAPHLTRHQDTNKLDFYDY
jgi:hypothetical protein